MPVLHKFVNYNLFLDSNIEVMRSLKSGRVKRSRRRSTRQRSVNSRTTSRTRRLSKARQAEARAENVAIRKWRKRFPVPIIRRAVRNGYDLSKTKRRGNVYTYPNGTTDTCDGFKGKNVECWDTL